MESEPPECRFRRFFISVVIPVILIAGAAVLFAGTGSPVIPDSGDLYAPGNLWVILCIFLAGSGFFSGAETALFSLDKLRMTRIEQRHPKGFYYVRALLSEPKKTLSTILLLNNFVNIGATLCAGALAGIYVSDSPVLSFLVGAVAVTLLILVIGEIMPKTVAIERSEKFALLAAPLMIFFTRIVYPVRIMLDGATRLIFRIFKFTPKEGSETFTEEDLKMMLMSGELDGLLEEDEREMIDGVFEFGSKTAEEIMTHRTEMEAYANNLTQVELIESVKNGNHSRVLVYEEDLDHIIGVLHVKDLLLNPERRYAELIRPPFMVPPKKELSTLLNEMQKTRSHLAVIVDEFGGTSGLVTLNDLLEEIVGEIKDAREAALEHKNIIRIAPDHYNISGMMEVEEINETFRFHLDVEVARTVGGYLFNTLGRIPERGDSIEIDGWRFRIMRMEGNRIDRVSLKKIGARKRIINKEASGE